MSEKVCDDVKVIHAFSFWEFCKAVEGSVKDGYEFSADNDKFPTSYVGHYSCKMVKGLEGISEIPMGFVSEVSTNTPVELSKEVVQQTPAKRGPKAKS